MNRRRMILFSGLGVGLASAVTAIAVTTHSAPPLRDRGLLTQAVVNATSHSGTAQSRIAVDPAHQAVVHPDSIVWYDEAGAQYRTDVAVSDSVTRLFDDKGFTNWRQDSTAGFPALLIQLLSPLLLIGAVFFVFRSMQSGGMLGGMRKSKAKLVTSDTPTVTFADVAGVDEAKAELAELVQVLRNPAKFDAIGAKIPRGVLLNGPPGTGKTLLARAVAGEAGVPFHSVSGSEFVEMFVGVGAARVRETFAAARKNAPSIIFIDEVDAVGRKRGSGQGNSNQESEQTLNQLLVEMDGFDSSAPVIVIAATNRPDILDQALLRPGRFDRRVTVDAPDLIGREAILTVHSRNKPFADDVDMHSIAKQTAGFAGAELANLLNEAALLAARHDRKVIVKADLEEATIRVMAGPERTRSLMTDEEKSVIAHHEMGHALVSHVLPHADPVHKISIVSRGRALGWTMILPERDKVLHSRAELTDQMAGLLGGRVAEEIMFGADFITSGAADDIERATKLAYRMVGEMGMSPLGLRAFLQNDPGMPRTYSEDLAEHVDAEVDRLLEEARLRARTVLTERRHVLEALAQRLIEVETMDREEMQSIVDRFPAQAVPRHAPAHRGRARVNVQPQATVLPVPAASPSGELAVLAPRGAAVAAGAFPRKLYLRRTVAAFMRFAGVTRANP